MHAAHEVGLLLDMIRPLDGKAEQAGFDVFLRDVRAQRDDVGAGDSLRDRGVSLNLLPHGNFQKYDLSKMDRSRLID
jgi:hypothetical protein